MKVVIKQEITDGLPEEKNYIIDSNNYERSNNGLGWISAHNVLNLSEKQIYELFEILKEKLK